MLHEQDWRARYASFLEEIRSALDAFKDLANGIQEGVKFYEQTHASAKELYQRVQEFCSQRKLQKEEALANLSAQESASNRGHGDVHAEYKQALDRYDKELDAYRRQTQHHMQGLNSAMQSEPTHRGSRWYPTLQ